MKGVAIDMIGIAILAAFTMIIGAGIIQTTTMDVSDTLPSQMTKAVQDIVDVIWDRTDYNLCDSLQGKKIKYGEFKTLLSTMLGGTCNHTQVQLDFSVSEADLEQMARDVGASGYLLIERTDPVGAGMIMVRPNPGLYVLKYDDVINITAAGSPKLDVMITVSVPGCDPYDEVCDIACSFKSGVCDGFCYRADQHEDVPCDIDCVDINRDRTITSDDKDGVCDRDCYNSINDPDMAYDPDCVPTTMDGVCDPDTNGVEDGTCDPDCFSDKEICDPDCGSDESCICDGECNGYCSIKCHEEIIYPNNDPDCLRDEEGTPCCGDGSCDFTEDCQKCGDDCPPVGGCAGLGRVCCPEDNTKDGFGCSSNTDIGEGELCKCDSQCGAGMACSPGKIAGFFCCPKGSKWDGKLCLMEADVLIVALKGTMKAVYSDSEINSLERKMGEFQEALADDGLGSLYLYLDQKETSDIIGSKVEDTTSSSQIQAVLEQLLPKLKVKYLIIVGGDSRFPQIDMPCGGCADPNYAQYQTDDFYVDFKPKDNMPDIPVGRIPDPNRGEMPLLLVTLDNYIRMHGEGGISLADHRSVIMLYDSNGARGPWASGVCAHETIFGVSCSSDATCTTNGKGGNFDSPNEADGHSFFILLVHGDNLVPQSFLWDSGRVFLNSGTIPSLDVEGSLWMIMACYAGMIDNKDTRGGSVVMQFFNGNGAIFFGGTRTQWGTTLGAFPCNQGGDNLIGTFYSNVGTQFSVGKTIGEAFLKGKKAYLSVSNVACSRRTAHQTLLYGDPTLKIKEVWYSAN